MEWEKQIHLQILSGFFANKIYSDLQKYWESDTFTVLLALHSGTLDIKLYNDYDVKV